MSYRLWEQVGHEPTVDSVALYEGEQPDRIATLEREIAELRKDAAPKIMGVYIDTALQPKEPNNE